MLQITRENLIKWSRKYDDRYRGTNDERTELRLKRILEAQRYLEKHDFIDLCMWKSPRPKKHYESNNADFVKEITQFSLFTENEINRIMILIELRGVSWPVASVILHFAFPDKYPILGFRAIWSLGWEKPGIYSFNFWQKYCHKISQISIEINLSIRTVDKALWEYSKENQERLTLSDRIIKKRPDPLIIDGTKRINFHTDKGLFQRVFNECDEYLQNLFLKLTKIVSDSFHVEHYPTDKPDYRFKKKNIFCELVPKPRKQCLQVNLRVDSHHIDSI
jgi:hypothetical protein